MTALCVGILLLIPLVDLGIKYYIEKNISEGSEMPILKDKIIVRHVHNEGAAMNLLDSHPSVVKWISFAAVVPIAIYFIVSLGKKGQTSLKISLSLALGGAISNLYDRFVRKYVLDYFAFKSRWKKVTNITFNLADMCIFAGALGLVVSSIFGKDR